MRAIASAIPEPEPAPSTSPRARTIWYAAALRASTASPARAAASRWPGTDVESASLDSSIWRRAASSVAPICGGTSAFSPAAWRYCSASFSTPSSTAACCARNVEGASPARRASEMASCLSVRRLVSAIIRSMAATTSAFHSSCIPSRCCSSCSCIDCSCCCACFPCRCADWGLPCRAADAACFMAAEADSAASAGNRPARTARANPSARVPAAASCSPAASESARSASASCRPATLAESARATSSFHRGCSAAKSRASSARLAISPSMAARSKSFWLRSSASFSCRCASARSCSACWVRAASSWLNASRSSSNCRRIPGVSARSSCSAISCIRFWKSGSSMPASSAAFCRSAIACRASSACATKFLLLPGDGLRALGVVERHGGLTRRSAASDARGVSRERSSVWRCSRRLSAASESSRCPTDSVATRSAARTSAIVGSRRMYSRERPTRGLGALSVATA